MVTVPAETPVTKPVPDPIVAIPGLPLLHVVVPDGSLSVVVAPTHNVVVPPIGAGNGLTVIMAVAIQPVASV